MEDSVQQVTGDALTPETSQRISWGELSMSLTLLALGFVVVFDGFNQPAAISASGIGAGLFPILVGILLVTVSVFLAIQVLRKKRGEPEDAEGDVEVTRLHWRQVAQVIGAFVFFIVALDVVGYIGTAAITFWVIANAIGARSHMRSALIALAVAAAVYLLFTLVLRIELPAGVFEGIL